MLNVKKTLTKLLSWAQDKNYVGYDFSNIVDITSYNSQNNLYTCPADGMIKTESNYRQGSYTILMESSGVAVAEGAAPATANAGGSTIICTQVYKGQKFYVTRGANNYGNAYFIPYKLGGGYFIASIFSRLAERWWEYAERKEDSYQNHGCHGRYGRDRKSYDFKHFVQHILRHVLAERSKGGIHTNSTRKCKYEYCSKPFLLFRTIWEYSIIRCMPECSIRHNLKPDNNLHRGIHSVRPHVTIERGWSCA
ncbi:MAG: hypothetical protein IKS01_05215 [Paludibacteraceae bacterium]|nr:hypothetical protein [Paludibacteraceae bacterium]